MPRTSLVHYIAPSSISITPNANGSANDVAVYVAQDAKIKVRCDALGIGMVDATFQEWTLAGRNRRLADSSSPYTIYARLAKSGEKTGYLVFAPKVLSEGEWVDKYDSVTRDGGGSGEDYWYIRLGDVSLPVEGARSIDFDTGVLGTDLYNATWEFDPGMFPLRVELNCTADDEDAGPTPYVYWGKSLVLLASLLEGWETAQSGRIDHWEISRNTGNPVADGVWDAAAQQRMVEVDGETKTFAECGEIVLSHARGEGDDFDGSVATTFTVSALGTEDDGGADLVVLASASVTVLSEVVEKYELTFSSGVVGYSPQTETYSPSGGVDVGIRATDQKGMVFDLTRGQLTAAGLTASYAPVGTLSWITLSFTGPEGEVAVANIPPSAFAGQKSVNVRLVNADAEEVAMRTVAFVRDGEDSREREWIFLRGTSAIIFSDNPGPEQVPALIGTGEVSPSGTAGGVTGNKNQSSWVPMGWTDNPQGTDSVNRYEYTAYRDYISATEAGDGTDGHWGDFSFPRIWSHYAVDGIVFSIEANMESVHIASDEESTTALLSANFYKREGTGEKERTSLYYAVTKCSAAGVRTQLVRGMDFGFSNRQITVSAGERIEIYCWDSSDASSSYDSWLVKKEILAVKDGNSGEDSLHVEVWGFDVIRNGVGSITLTAHAFRGEEDITDTLSSMAFSWIKESSDAHADDNWNALHVNYGNIVTVDSADILRRANISCVVNYDLTI